MCAEVRQGTGMNNVATTVECINKKYRTLSLSYVEFGDFFSRRATVTTSQFRSDLSITVPTNNRLMLFRDKQLSRLTCYKKLRLHLLLWGKQFFLT